MERTRRTTPLSEPDAPASVEREIVVDRFLGDHPLSDAHASLLQGSWQPAQALLKARPFCWRSIRALSGPGVPLEMTQAWHASAPTHHTLLMLAHGLMHHIDRGQVASHRRVIERVESLLFDAARVEPRSADPWAMLVSSGQVLGLDTAALVARHAEAHARTPHHPPAASALATALSPRRGGSVERLTDFAEQMLHDAPPGSPALGSVADAEVELAARSADESFVSLLVEMRSEPRPRRIEEALHKLLAGIETVAPIDTVDALNRLLFWTSPTSRRSAELNRRGFDALDGRLIDTVWCTIDQGPEPAITLARIQRRRLQLSDAILRSTRAFANA